MYRIDWNGHPKIPWYRRRLRRRVRYALRRHPRLYITATSDGSHSPTSWHYSGHAVDFGSDDARNGPEKRAQRDLHERFGNEFLELFGPKAFYVKNGSYVSGHFPDHGDHLHLAA